MPTKSYGCLYSPRCRKQARLKESAYPRGHEAYLTLRGRENTNTPSPRTSASSTSGAAARISTSLIHLLVDASPPDRAVPSEASQQSKEDRELLENKNAVICGGVSSSAARSPGHSSTSRACRSPAICPPSMTTKRQGKGA